MTAAALTITLSIVVVLLAIGLSMLVGRLLERASATHELMERNPPTQKRQD